MKPIEKQFVIEYVDGDLSRVGIVHGIRENTLLIEWIDYISMISLCSTGRCPSMEDEDIVQEQFYEIERHELGTHKFFYTWDAVCGEFIRRERGRKGI